MEMNYPVARLVVLEGDQTRTVLLTRALHDRAAGRSHLSLSSSQVSREHAVIHFDVEGYLIQDQGSRHGTLVNGIRTDFARLKAGDRIELGTSDVVLSSAKRRRRCRTRSLLAAFQEMPTASELEKLSLFLQAAQSFSNTRLLNDVLELDDRVHAATDGR